MGPGGHKPTLTLYQISEVYPRTMPGQLKAPYQKGQSGNPSGRSKSKQAMLKRGHECTPAIWEQLLKDAVSHKSYAARHSAAKIVLAYTHGKPKTIVQLDAQVGVQHFVMRAPAVVASAEAWEALAQGWDAYTKARETLELKAVPEPPPPEPEPLPENPPYPRPSPANPVGAGAAVAHAVAEHLKAH